MKNKSFFIKLIAIILLVAAAVTAFIVFRDEISYFFYSVRYKVKEFIEKKKHADEFADYADV